MSIKEVLQNKLLKIGGIKIEEKLIPHTINIYLINLDKLYILEKFFKKVKLAVKIKKTPSKIFLVK